MAYNLKFSAALKNAQQDAITAKAGANALIDILAGTQLANPDTAIAATTLSGAITNSALALVLASAAGFPAAGNFVLFIENEQVLVTAGQGSANLTVTRGYNNTTAAAHASGVAITNAIVLATATCNATFAPASSAGVVTLNAITSGTGTAAAGTGTNATWYRLKTSAGVPLVDGTVGVSASDLNLNNVNIATGQAVAISTGSYTNAN